MYSGGISVVFCCVLMYYLLHIFVVFVVLLVLLVVYWRINLFYHSKIVFLWLRSSAQPGSVQYCVVSLCGVRVVYFSNNLIIYLTVWYKLVVSCVSVVLLYYCSITVVLL